MKILHMIDHMGCGGAQTVLKGILGNQKNNSDIYLFVLRKSEISNEIDHPNVFICESPKRFSFKPLGQLRKLIEREKIDVLHCHLFRAKIFACILKRRYFPDIKIIFHEHGRICSNDHMYSFFLDLSKTLVDRFVTNSFFTESKLFQKTGISHKKSTVIYNFVESKKFCRENISWDISSEREKLGIKEGEFVVGFASRLIERKGWREYLTAARFLLEKHCDIKFLIAGEGKDNRKMLKSVKNHGLDNTIVYLGYVSNMQWFYSILDCFVLSSRWEPMGITELEAQSSGVSVIAADVPALNEIITDGQDGLLFESEDHGDLAHKIEMLIKDATLRNKIARGGLKSAKKYCVDDYNMRLQGLYCGLF